MNSAAGHQALLLHVKSALGLASPMASGLRVAIAARTDNGVL